MLLWSAFLVGLLSNIHCMGMCGPISLAVPVVSNNRLISVLIYNSGRITTYIILGLIFGVVGNTIVIAGFQQYFSLLIGVIIVLYIIYKSLYTPIYFKYSSFNLFIKFKGFFKTYFLRKTYKSNFILGFLNGFLPCGMVYLAIGGAMISGTWLNGAFYMLFFGIGTLPAMVFLPQLNTLFSDKMKYKINLIKPFILFFFGVFFILRGANLGIPYLSPQVIKVTDDKKRLNPGNENLESESCCEIKCKKQ